MSQDKQIVAVYLLLKQAYIHVILHSIYLVNKYEFTESEKKNRFGGTLFPTQNSFGDFSSSHAAVE
jgi:hypothetical protein